MHTPRVVAGAWTALAIAALAFTPTALAKSHQVEPLNQYLVSGKISGDDLARRGFDMREAVTPGAHGAFSIVATPKQAAELADKGATVRAPFGLARSNAAPSSPLTNPTHGYDVFRPWSLTPAACPTTCSTPEENLKTWYHDEYRANRDIAKEVVYGRSLLGQDLIAYRLTAGDGGGRGHGHGDRHRRGDRRKPAVLFDGTQHAREWIATEVTRRLFQYVLEHKRDRASGIPQLLRTRELWIVPVVNPDGYDYTFTSKATRLWRKNLRDVNGDGVITNGDGVDTNRNWPDKWNYDLEGASDDPTTEVYHGSGPASEPEVSAYRALEERIRAKFQIDYHSFAKLILYPEGWQVETLATDWPLTTALAGDDAKPAVEGFDPDVSAELYTTNGDITDDSLKNTGTEAFTVELSGGTGDDVGGTVDGPDSFSPGGFVFQDSEAAVQAEFEKNLPFALDLAKTAGHPDTPDSHLGNTAPDFVPSTFPTSYGSPQTVEVNAKRSLGAVQALYQVNGGRTRSLGTREFAGGDRYGEPGIYYHRLRARIPGIAPGDKVRVWFTAGRRHVSDPFTFTVKSNTHSRVLLMAAEDYTGRSADISADPYAGPLYLETFKQALGDAGIGYDVYDVDAENRTAPSALGVLSHYDAIVWYTGEDLYVREPGQPGGTGVSKLLDDEILNVRDYLNEGGHALINGKFALQGGWDQFLYNPQGAPPNPYCATNQTTGNGDVPEGQVFNCVYVSNDFQQYWLGAYLPIGVATDNDTAAGLPLQEVPPFGTTAFGLNGADSAQNQDNVYSFLTTSSILKPDVYPQFKSDKAITIDRPAAFDPPDGSKYVFSQASDSSFKRLTKTFDLTGKTSADLQMQISADTEPDWDYLAIEAHTVGQDDWTTLPDQNGHTTQDLGLSCPQIPMVELHPFVKHYETYTGPAGGSADATCEPVGTIGNPVGAWNAFTGNSGGFQPWKIDLSAYAGKQVEVSISYISDVGTQGLGVFVDDAKVTADGAVIDSTSFEDGLGGWSVPGAPEGSPANHNDWIQTGSVGYIDGPGVATKHSVYWGFGLEGVTGADTRATLVKDALAQFGVSPG
jgi:hypothetical protein